MKKLLLATSAFFSAASIVLPGMAIAQTAAQFNAPAVTLSYTQLGTVINCIGPSGCMRGQYDGQNLGNTGNQAYLYRYSAQLPIVFAVGLSQRRLNFDMTTGYQPSTQSGGVVGIADGVVVDDGGYNYAGGVDTVSLAAGGSCTIQTATLPYGPITGCAFATAPTVANQLISSVNTSTGYGALLTPRQPGYGTFGVSGDYTGGSVAREADFVAVNGTDGSHGASVSIYMLDLVQNDLVRSINIPAVTFVNGSTVATLAAPIPYGVTKNVYITSVGCLSLDTYIVSFNSSTSINLSAPATCSTTKGAFEAGTELNFLLSEIKQLTQFLIKNGKTVLLQAAKPQTEAGCASEGWGSTDGAGAQCWLFNVNRIRFNKILEAYVQNFQYANPQVAKSVILTQDDYKLVDLTSTGNFAPANMISVDQAHLSSYGAELVGYDTWQALQPLVVGQGNPPRSLGAASYYDPAMNPAGDEGGNAVSASCTLTTTSNTTLCIGASYLNSIATWQGTEVAFFEDFNSGTTAVQSAGTLTLSSAISSNPAEIVYGQASQYSQTMVPGAGGTNSISTLCTCTAIPFGYEVSMPTRTFQGKISNGGTLSGNSLSVTSMNTSGVLEVGDALSGTNVNTGSISVQNTGIPPGTAGNYTITGAGSLTAQETITATQPTQSSFNVTSTVSAAAQGYTGNIWNVVVSDTPGSGNSAPLVFLDFPPSGVAVTPATEGWLTTTGTISINGQIMTVTNPGTNPIVQGELVSAPGVQPGTYILATSLQNNAIANQGIILASNQYYVSNPNSVSGIAANFYPQAVAECDINWSAATNVNVFQFVVQDDDSTASYDWTNQTAPTQAVVSSTTGPIGSSFFQSVVTPPMPVHSGMTKLQAGIMYQGLPGASSNGITIALSNCSIHRFGVF